MIINALVRLRPLSHVHKQPTVVSIVVVIRVEQLGESEAGVIATVWWSNVD